MNKMPKNQQRAMAIICMVVVFAILLMLAFMDISVFFIFLVAVIVGVCVLRVKKPQLFQLFAKAKPADAAKPAFDDLKREAFSAHIILLYQGGMTMQQIMVDRKEFSIGRSPTCNFVLSGNTDISRTHAIIRYDEERDCSTITDNHSSHGTKVNGTFLNPGESRTLHNGDLIQIEDRVLTVQNKNY